MVDSFIKQHCEDGLYFQSVKQVCNNFLHFFRKCEGLPSDFLETLKLLQLSEDVLAIRLVSIQGGIITPITFWLVDGEFRVNNMYGGYTIDLDSLEKDYGCLLYVHTEPMDFSANKVVIKRDLDLFLNAEPLENSVTASAELHQRKIFACADHVDEDFGVNVNSAYYAWGKYCQSNRRQIPNVPKRERKLDL